MLGFPFTLLSSEIASYSLCLVAGFIAGREVGYRKGREESNAKIRELEERILRLELKGEGRKSEGSGKGKKGEGES